jgi:pimeloyl-ACP methyl ester carboxylesterase
MKRRWLIYSVLCVIAVFGITSCTLFDNESQIPITENKYLISYTQVASYPQQLVKLYFDSVGKKYPDAAGISQKVQYGFWVYKLNYKTEFKGQDVVASGLVCIPMSTGTFPLLSFQNGTNTLHSEAPSVNYNDSLFLMIEAVSSLGFVVAMPDYLGFGASKDMFHPYLEKTSTIQTVTDMFRAVKEMASPSYLNFTLSKDTYLMGYSQGGWATMALTNELETKLSSEFNLKASSCGAGPYDLTLICKTILGQQTYLQPYFMAYILNSYILNKSITNNYADILNAPYSGSGIIPGLFDGTKDASYINSKLTTTVNDLFTQDFRANFETGNNFSSLRTALADNSVKAWKTTKPILMVHGQGDTFVTPLVSTNIYSGFIALGVSTTLVNYVPVPLLDHDEAVVPWGVLSLNWMLKYKN